MLDISGEKALKILKLDANSEKMIKLLESEVQAVMNFNHRNIVKYYEFQKQGQYVKTNSGESK